MKTSSGTQRICSTSAGLSKTFLPITMPEILIIRQTTTPVATTRGVGYTEYQMVYTIAANTRWTMTATTLPQGVTLQTEEGTFQNEVGAIVTRGQATNPTQQKVTVRVANGTQATWQQNLQLELRGLR